MAALTAEQKRVARKVLAVGKSMGAKRSELLAAIETGLVESNLTNIKGGDADSSGWRQERAMYYPNPNNVGAAAKRFFKEIRSTRGSGMTPGQKAQATQRSAFPERYDQREDHAKAIIKALDGLDLGGGGGKSKSLTHVTGTPPKATAGGTDYAAAIVDTLLNNRGESGSLLKSIIAAETNPAYQIAPTITDAKIKKTKVKLPAAGPGDVLNATGKIIRKDGWKGSKSAGDFIELNKILKGTGNTATGKRATQMTASGNVSDHYEGNKDSYAWDISGGDMDKAARVIARKLGLKTHKGTQNVTKTINGRKYRFQLLWQVADHYDHVHLGVDREDTPG